MLHFETMPNRFQFPRFEKIYPVWKTKFFSRNWTILWEKWRKTCENVAFSDHAQSIRISKIRKNTPSSKYNFFWSILTFLLEKWTKPCENVAFWDHAQSIPISEIRKNIPGLKNEIFFKELDYFMRKMKENLRKCCIFRLCPIDSKFRDSKK